MKFAIVIENKNIIKHNQFEIKFEMNVTMIVFNAFKFSYFKYFNINLLVYLISATLI
jgi:hypothetical protein